MKPCWEILFTFLFSTHRSLVFHGGDVFTESRTAGTLSTALKAPEISSDLFQEVDMLDEVWTVSQGGDAYDV